MNKFLKSTLVLSLCSVLLLTSGCSWFGGKKKGSGTSDDSSLSDSDLNGKDLNGRNGNIASAEGEGMFRDIHFDYDSPQLSAEGEQDVEYNAQVLKDNPKLRVQVEGHCDERGTDDYNMALGQKRANTVASALANNGVDESSYSTISYGENVPLVQGSSEMAYAKNRRVHFSVNK